MEKLASSLVLTLGGSGIALAVYDFADCMSWV